MSKIGEQLNLTRQRIHQILSEQGVSGEYNVDFSVKHRYSREDCIARLKEFYHRHGRAPLTQEWEGPPSSTTIASRFGSWTEALIKAGIYTRHHRKKTKYSERELIQFLRDAKEKLGRPPTSEKLDSLEEFPAATTFVKRFGSWSKALEKAGFDVQRRGENKGKRYSDRMILHKLRRVIEKLGETPTIRQWNERYTPPSTSTICNRFESWSFACHRAIKCNDDVKPLAQT